MTDLDAAAAAEPRWLVPRGLIVVLAVTGLLVSVLAIREFASILGPVLLALILAMGVHPLTGILRRRGAPMWLAVTVTLVTLLGVILSLAASLALAVGQLATILPLVFRSFACAGLGPAGGDDTPVRVVRGRFYSCQGGFGAFPSEDVSWSRLPGSWRWRGCGRAGGRCIA